MKVDVIPDSYYFGALNDTRKYGTRGNSAHAIQQRDKEIAIQQDPVGWFFFTYDNVATILARLNKSFTNITLAVIFPTMIKYYNLYQPTGTLEDISPYDLAVAVDALNHQTEAEVTRTLLDMDAGTIKYARYRLDGDITLEKHAHWTRMTRREQGPKNVASLVASQAPMPFVIPTEASTVTSQAVGSGDKYADYPMKELEQQLAINWQ